MNKKICALLLAILMLFAVSAAYAACARMGGMMCQMQASNECVMQSSGCMMQNSSCPMGNGGCMMMNSSCPMGNEGCMMMNSPCPMGNEGCMMQNSSCPMGNGGCMMMNSPCPMSNEGCVMQNSSCPMMQGAGSASVPCSLPCARADHMLCDGILPPGYHFVLCKDCTLVTGTDFYLCMSACSTCGLHTHAQESEHSCPLEGWVLN